MSITLKALRGLVQTDKGYVLVLQGDELPADVTEDELERLRANDAITDTEAPNDPEDRPLASLSDEELAAWVAEQNQDEVLAAAGDDTTMASRLHAAEESRGDKARKQLLGKLERIAVA